MEIDKTKILLDAAAAMIHGHNVHNTYLLDMIKTYCVYTTKRNNITTYTFGNFKISVTSVIDGLDYISAMRDK